MDTVNKIRVNLLGLVIAGVIGASIYSYANIQPNRDFKIADSDSVVYLNPDTTNVELTTMSVKDSLIAEVDAYLKKAAPSTKLKGECIVDACIKYNLDINFVLAQAQIESNFGTAGIAKKTNSPWNVGAYDRRSSGEMIRKGYGYKDPNESIDKYMRLLRRNYLVNGKTEHDLMNNFVTRRGLRYASSRSYESSLKKTYNKINKVTNIDELFNQYKQEMQLQLANEQIDSTKIV